MINPYSIRLIKFIFFLLTYQSLNGQDAQFTQLGPSAIYTNPAFTGMRQSPRIQVQHRRQWTGLSFPNHTSLAAFDYFIPTKRGRDIQDGFGVGIIALHDETGVPKLSTQEISGLVAFEKVLKDFTIGNRQKDRLFARIGLQAGYRQRRLNGNGFLYQDQINNIGIDGIPNSTDPTNDAMNSEWGTGSPDVSVGVLLSTYNYWIGWAWHHTTNPDQSFRNVVENRLLSKMTIHGGAIFDFKGDFFFENVKLEGMYRSQGGFDQIDVNLTSHINPVSNPLVLGIGYRGISPMKIVGDRINNSDAMAIIIGFEFSDISFGYSYDRTISQLGNQITKGSHEIYLSVSFSKKDYFNIKEILVCPDKKRQQRIKRDRYPMMTTF